MELQARLGIPKPPPLWRGWTVTQKLGRNGIRKRGGLYITVKELAGFGTRDGAFASFVSFCFAVGRFGLGAGTPISHLWHSLSCTYRHGYLYFSLYD